MTHAQLSAEFRRLADLFRDNAPADSDWDFSEASLERLDEFLDQTIGDEEPEDAAALIQVWGGYVAVVVQTHLEGEWRYDDGKGVRFEAKAEPPVEFNPFAWLQNRFDRGREDSVAFKYEVMKAATEGRLPSDD